MYFSRFHDESNFGPSLLHGHLLVSLSSCRPLPFTVFSLQAHNNFPHNYIPALGLINYLFRSQKFIIRKRVCELAIIYIYFVKLNSSIWSKFQVNIHNKTQTCAAPYISGSRSDLHLHVMIYRNLQSSNLSNNIT